MLADACVTSDTHYYLGPIRAEFCCPTTANTVKAQWYPLLPIMYQREQIVTTGVHAGPYSHCAKSWVGIRECQCTEGYTVYSWTQKSGNRRGLESKIASNGTRACNGEHPVHEMFGVLRFYMCGLCLVILLMVMTTITTMMTTIVMRVGERRDKDADGDNIDDDDALYKDSDNDSEDRDNNDDDDDNAGDVDDLMMTRMTMMIITVMVMVIVVVVVLISSRTVLRDRLAATVMSVMTVTAATAMTVLTVTAATAMTMTVTAAIAMTRITVICITVLWQHFGVASGGSLPRASVVFVWF